MKFHYLRDFKNSGTRNTFIPALPALTRCTVETTMWKKREKPQNPQRRSQPGKMMMNGEDSSGLGRLCVRMNTLHHIRSEVETLGKKAITRLRNAESAQADVSNGAEFTFDLTLACCQEGIQNLCEITAYKASFQDLRHVIWEGLYVGDPSSSRIDPAIKELDQILAIISTGVHSRLKNRVLTALMKATFDAFLLVLLAGGPSRAFSQLDSQVIEQDFASIKELFLADGDGLPEELVEKAGMQARAVIPLFKADTESLIDRFKRAMAESGGNAVKSKLPLPPTTRHWSPTEPNTILRVLCHRNDEAASRYLKKTYGLPKKL